MLYTSCVAAASTSHYRTRTDLLGRRTDTRLMDPIVENYALPRVLLAPPTTEPQTRLHRRPESVVWQMGVSSKKLEQMFFSQPYAHSARHSGLCFGRHRTGLDTTYTRSGKGKTLPPPQDISVRRS